MSTNQLQVPRGLDKKYLTGFRIYLGAMILLSHVAVLSFAFLYKERGDGKLLVLAGIFVAITVLLVKVWPKAKDCA